MSFLPTMPIGSPVYGAAMLIGVASSACFFMRLAKSDQDLFPVYLITLLSAFMGAKLGYIFAESWIYYGTENFIASLLSGKTILGAILFGYFGAEFAKSYFKYDKITGDLFARVVPITIILGRIGCYYSGCCTGKVCPAVWYALVDEHGDYRFPTVPLEILFHVTIVALLIYLRRQNKLPGQHFHIYMITYGLFRFFEEFLRDTPPIALNLTGYHFLALLLAITGLIRFKQRENSYKTAS